ncbi:MAG: acyl-CoA desaturase [Polyangiaceae bacterium]
MQATSDLPEENRPFKSIDYSKSIPFFLMHVTAVVGLFVFGWSTKGFLIALAFYYVRMFGVTAGYHRLFSHRSFKANRFVQFLFAFLAMTSAQKGVIWWASHHRTHHKYSDQPGDIHSAKLEGLWWSHVGWILSDKYAEVDHARVKDLERLPELRFLERWFLLPPLALTAAVYFIGGIEILYWAMAVSTVMLWHGTFTINSFTHLWGRRRYATTDNSKNSLFFALVTMGEGWHNNHHYYQRSCRQGFYWWEIDLTFYVLKVLEVLHIVYDVQGVSRAVRDARPAEGGELAPRGSSIVSAPGSAPTLPGTLAEEPVAAE